MEQIISAIIGFVFGVVLGVGVFQFGFLCGKRSEARRTPEMEEKEPMEEAEEHKRRQEQWDNLMTYTGRRKNENK